MSKTPVTDAVNNDSDESGVRTQVDPVSREIGPEDLDAGGPIPPIPEVVEAFRKTLPILGRDLPETQQDPADFTKPELDETLPPDAGATSGPSDAAGSFVGGISGPARIGPFPVLGFLGSGTFGNVYLARDVQLDRLVAIKVPRPERFTGTEDIDRFLHEARLAARISHSGVVKVYQADRDQEFGCFVVLEFIAGKSLAERLRGERLTPACAAEMLKLAADALASAHEIGLVHRDLKPENILLDKGGRPHVADFGLAVHEDDRWPRRWEVAGTAYYMAPEQVRGESHRLDGRTDVWALGVILYKMLTNRLPFDGSSKEEVFDGVLYREAVPPRQRDRNIPKGLERICLKCVSKLMTDRYATASDLAEDLEYWLRPPGRELPEGSLPVTKGPLESEKNSPSRDPGTDESAIKTAVRVRPKGLRAFDIDDRDYFLGLLPGPRDRHGLPESIRFWKVRIEPGKREDPFAVGLLCGPSGSGKTSMVRAGLMCQLDEAVVLPVYVEATPGTTEARLLAALLRVTSEGAAGMNLRETVAGMRTRALLPPGRKVLIVLDQFEQWLLADHERDGDESELVAALRQCDGFNVQCLIMVRDDFGMAAARFMRSLEIRLVESHNFAAVEPFEPVHARKVLREFGLAYERFHDDEKGPHDRFLDQAVGELAQDGKIAPVRLALLAQMIKDKPWTPATLKEVGGLEGIGRTFLEESLAGPVANPEHRLHLPAARRVLQALLPDGLADIKGHMRSYHELLQASGYARRPRDFDTLLAILGIELRLITPTDPRDPDRIDLEQPGYPGERYYHLTHDYLVPSLREWLRQKDNETISGRAAIRLTERTAEWTARRSRRYLPSWWEWLVMLLFTRASRRGPAERRMLRAASLFHGTRIAVVAILLLVVANWIETERARSAVHQLKIAESKNVPQMLEGIDPLRHWADPRLRDEIDDERGDAQWKTRARLALLPVDRSQATGLLAPLLDDQPNDFLVIRRVLVKNGDRTALERDFRGVLRNEKETPSRRLRACMALVELLGGPQANEDPDLRMSAGILAKQFVGDLLTHPERFNDWLEALKPARSLFIPHLATIFRQTSQADSARSAAAILAKYAVNEPDTLIDLLLDANDRQFPIILDALTAYRVNVSPQLDRLVKGSPPANATADEKNAFIGRQANAVIALFHWGDSGTLWPLLQHSPDPLLRTYLIDRLSRLTPDPVTLAERLNEEPDVSARRALLLILGGLPPERRSPSWTAKAVDRLLRLFQSHSDPGIHSAAEWTLRQWGHGEKLGELQAPLATGAPVGQRDWYLTRKGGHTMVRLRPVPFLMGAGESENEHDSDEAPHTEKIPSPFFIATREVTFGQFLEFMPRFRDRFRNEPMPDENSPVPVVTFFDAVRYCRWLSDKEGIDQNQMCYPPLAELTETMKLPDTPRSRTGYRLAMEDEWEYSCRANAVTSRSFGNDEAMLLSYGWFVKNSPGQPQPCGRLLPNDFGLFDMLGNAREWCQDPYSEKPHALPKGGAQALSKPVVLRVARGGCCLDQARALRCANRFPLEPGSSTYSLGFRIARTAPKPP